MARNADVRERLVDAALRVLNEGGPGELTVRRIAEAAGSSTMGVYSRFGGRTGVLDALYRRGFDLLEATLAAVPEADDPRRRIVDIAIAYREFALANPLLYALMFERPLPDFDPEVQARQDALATNFGFLVAAVRHGIAQGTFAGDDAVRTSYLIWCAAHGMVGLELTHALRQPLPGWILDSPEAGESLFRAGIEAILTGLSTRI